MKTTPLFKIEARRDGTLLLAYLNGESEQYQPIDASGLGAKGSVLFRFQSRWYKRVEGTHS